MKIYHKIVSNTFSSINGDEKEQNASYDSIKGFRGDLRVNNRYRILTNNEVEKILFPEKKKTRRVKPEEKKNKKSQTRKKKEEKEKNKEEE